MLTELVGQCKQSLFMVLSRVTHGAHGPRMEGPTR